MLGLLGRPFRTKIGIALIGARVVGGVSAAVLARPTVPSHVALVNTGGSQTTTSSSTLATSGATASADQSAMPGTAPTTAARGPEATPPGNIPPQDTPTTAAQPTRTPRPVPSATATATATPSSVTSLQGIVGSKNLAGNTFMLGPSGPTVDENGSTLFSGAATTWSALTNGMQADVRGVTESNGHFLAYSVNSDS